MRTRKEIEEAVTSEIDEVARLDLAMDVRVGALLEVLLDIRDLLSQEKPHEYPTFSTIPLTPVSLSTIAVEAGKKSTEALKTPFPVSEKDSVENECEWCNASYGGRCQQHGPGGDIVEGAKHVHVSDGLVYTSIPQQYKCKICGQFYY